MSPSNINDARVLSCLRAATTCRPINAADIADQVAATLNLTDCQPLHWAAELAELAQSGETEPRSSYALGERLSPDAVDSLSHLVNILESRKSEIFSTRASGAALMELLNLLTLRRRADTDSAGRKWESRYFPSSGGTHCIEPLLHVHDALGHAPGWFCVVGSGARDVRRVAMPEGDVLIEEVMVALRLERPPSATLYAVADPDRLLARYPTGSSLLWRDAGAFLAVAQLCVGALGLSGAIAGIAHELPADTRRLPPFVVGALGLGGGEVDALSNPRHSLPELDD